MKNKYIGKITLLMLFIACITLPVLLTGCGGDTVSEIYITNADLPLQTYVQGQELDLSEGLLTVVLNGEEAKVPLNDSSVTVSGYDKDTLGDQTVTVTYGDLTATFAVKVLPRIVAENYETKYFVGDKLNLDLGRLKITGDDTKTFTVSFNDKRVSVVSFDSSREGTVPVTLRYSDGTVTYDATYEVTVYGTSNMKFTPPTQTNYASHKTEVNLNGGYLTILASDNSLEKKVPLTADMIKGFDLSVATMENRTTPAEQVLTVEYLGQKFEYKIYITFSGVSVINQYDREVLSKLDLSKPMTEEERTVAFEALREYYDLAKSDIAALSGETVQTVVRTGTVAVNELFKAALEECADTFTMDDAGEVFLKCETYEGTAEDLEVLQDEESDLNVYKTLLRKLAEEFADVQVQGGKTVADLAVVYSPEYETLLVEMLAHFVRSYELLEDVPENWTVESLKAHGENIITAALEIHNTEYYKNGMGNYYTDILSPWRTNNDYFEILYSYFLYVYDGEDDFMTSYMFNSMPMPGILEDWFECFLLAYRLELQCSYYYKTELFLADLSQYMYYYFLTEEVAEMIKNSGNQLWIDIYNEYDLDNMTKAYLTNQNFGYMFYTQAMVDSKAYSRLWDQYYEILKLQVTGKLNGTTHKLLLCQMFDTFQNMSPSEVFGFLSSLHLMYNQSRGVISMLEYDEDTVRNVFTMIIRDNYSKYLTAASRPLLAKMLVAMENYALVGYKDEALADFKTLMGEIISTYNTLSKDDQDSFMEYCGDAFTQYKAIYDVLTNGKTLTLTTEETAKLDAFKKSLDRFVNVYGELTTKEQITTIESTLIYSLYAKVSADYDAFVASAGPDALTKLFTEEKEAFGTKYTLEKAYYLVDSMMTSLMLRNSATITDADGKTAYVTGWDLFANYGLEQIYAKMAELMYFGVVDATAAPLDAEVASLMSDVRNMSEFQLRVFNFMGGDQAYFAAERAYIEYKLANEAVAAQLAENLVKAEVAYVNYRLNNKDVTYKAEFANAMERVKKDYATLSDANKELLADAYEFYLKIFNEMIA